MSQSSNDQNQLRRKTRQDPMPDDKGQALHDRYGQVLLKLLIGLAFALVIVQLLLHYEPSRPYLSPIQQMEGVPVNEPNVNDWMGENTPSLLHRSS
ncbi:DUF5359 family protein [Paenibacillus sp. JNUCC32]|uniref:DUF5359 family protein n=1 Tax=Paenibacillus TaxID=44249 RepID=UPI001788756F|nr:MULTISPECIES: DUF5359 family protein [Paenibacillus]QOT13151.1 DUF5359 family protein [Paenibacillus sp. JNUCC-32]GIP02284.1 hypothetical protein J28TS4_06910 [Paenibacillus lautus]